MAGLTNRAMIVDDDSACLDDDLVARADALGIRACISKDRDDDIPDALWRYGPAA